MVKISLNGADAKRQLLAQAVGLYRRQPAAGKAYNERREATKE